MDLEDFRDVVYGQYSETHAVYSQDATDDRSGRFLNYREVLRRHLPADRTIALFDFGCGDGQLLRAAQSLGYANLTGVDVAEGMIALARRNCPAARLSCGNALDVVSRLPAVSLDAIIAYDVFEHLTRPELLETLRAMHRVLVPGGLVITHLPNGNSPFVGRIRYGDITHELAFTAASLRLVAGPAGFREIRCFEERPTAHGVVSSVRALLWHLVRLPALFWLAVETGRVRGHVLSMNMVATLRKA